MIDQGQDEQRIPARPLVHRVHQSSIGSDTGKCATDHGLNRVRTEQVGPDDAALAADFQPLRQRFQGLPGPGRLCRTIGGDQHQLRGIIAAGQSSSSESVESSDQCRSSRARIERARGSQLLDEFGELAEHAVASDAEVPLRQLSQIRSACQPRHLREPCGRPAVKQRDHFGAVRLAAQAPERLQNRDVRLHLAAAFQALAASDARGGGAANSLQECIQESRLAHSGFAWNTDELPLSHREPLQTPRAGSSSAVPRSISTGASDGVSTVRGAGAAAARHAAPSKPVASPRNCFDQCAVARELSSTH